MLVTDTHCSLPLQGSLAFICSEFQAVTEAKLEAQNILLIPPPLGYREELGVCGCSEQHHEPGKFPAGMSYPGSYILLTLSSNYLEKKKKIESKEWLVTSFSWD